MSSIRFSGGKSWARDKQGSNGWMLIKLLTVVAFFVIVLLFSLSSILTRHIDKLQTSSMVQQKMSCIIADVDRSADDVTERISNVSNIVVYSQDEMIVPFYIYPQMEAITWKFVQCLGTYPQYPRKDGSGYKHPIFNVSDNPLLLQIISGPSWQYRLGIAMYMSLRSSPWRTYGTDVFYYDEYATL